MQSDQGRRKLSKLGWLSNNVWGGGHNLPPLVDIGLIDGPKLGWGIANITLPSPTSLAVTQCTYRVSHIETYKVNQL